MKKKPPQIRTITLDESEFNPKTTLGWGVDDEKPIGLLIDCEICHTPITEQGALIFSPPQRGMCGKHHFCRKCYYKLYDVWKNLNKYEK